MKIELLTDYVDKDFSDLKQVFGISESISTSFALNPFLHYFLLYDNKSIIGYLSFNVLYDKLEILCIQVLEPFRKKGYGSKLMERLLLFCKENKIVNITLEVRQNNLSAINLYKKFHFKEVAIRKGYYNGIDGILMERKMI